MNSFKVWTLSVFFLLCVTPTVHSFEAFLYRQIGPAVFYFNPIGFPDHYAADDPRVTALPEAQQTEERIKIFEEEFKIALDAWSSVSGSTFVAIYGGQSTTDCYDRYDGVFMVCIIADQEEYFTRDGSEVAAVGGPGLVSLDLPFRFARDGFVHFNAKFTHLGIAGRVAATHEVGHVLGLDHEDEQGVFAVMNSGINLANPPEGLQPDDIAGIRFLYPFTEACAPVFEVEGSDISFVAEIYLDGTLYQTRLSYREDNDLGYLEVTDAVENPVLERNCALKFDGNDLLIPYIKLGDQMYELKLELNLERLSLDVVAAQSVN